MEDINERDEYLEKERNIIKDLLLSKINKDGYEEIYKRYLRQTTSISNKLIIDYFNSREPEEKEELSDLFTTKSYPVNNSTSEDIYEKYDEYIDIYNSKKKLDENYSIEADLDYRHNLMRFTANYNISKRLLEITEWYFNTVSDDNHSKEQLVDIITMDGERMFALRDVLSDKEMGLNFDKEVVDITDNIPFLVTLLNMRLCHDCTMANIRLIKEISEENKDALSGTLLFHVLNTASFLSFIKEHDCPIDQLDLNHTANSIRKLINDYKDDNEISVPIDFPETLNEIDNIIANADFLSTKFNNQKSKRLN